MDKIYVRKCERYTIWDASEPIVVDVEKLRKCEPRVSLGIFFLIIEL
jgi:hypothetical protein